LRVETSAAERPAGDAGSPSTRQSDMGPASLSHGHAYEFPSAAHADGHVSPADPQWRGAPKAAAESSAEGGKGGAGPGPAGAGGRHAITPVATAGP